MIENDLGKMNGNMSKFLENQKHIVDLTDERSVKN